MLFYWISSQCSRQCTTPGDDIQYNSTHYISQSSLLQNLYPINDHFFTGKGLGELTDVCCQQLQQPVALTQDCGGSATFIFRAQIIILTCFIHILFLLLFLQHQIHTEKKKNLYSEVIRVEEVDQRVTPA